MSARAAIAVLLLACLWCSAPSAVVAEDDPEVIGAQLFEQAVKWVNHDAAGVREVKTFEAFLDDVQLDVGNGHQEGYLRVWYQAPDKLRQEWRTTRDARSKPTVKILDGDRMWIVSPSGAARRVHGTPDGARAVAQLKSDKDRLANLARFITLEGLKGEGVTFTHMGVVQTRSGGWIRIRRTREGETPITLDFASAVVEDTPRVTYPVFVTIHADAEAGRPARTYSLTSWQADAKPFRFPGRIEAHERPPGAGETPKRFLLAFPTAIRLNVELDARRLFADPTKAGAGPK